MLNILKYLNFKGLMDISSRVLFIWHTALGFTFTFQYYMFSVHIGNFVLRDFS